MYAMIVTLWFSIVCSPMLKAQHTSTAGDDKGVRTPRWAGVNDLWAHGPGKGLSETGFCVTKGSLTLRKLKKMICLLRGGGRCDAWLGGVRGMRPCAYGFYHREGASAPTGG